MRAESIHFQPLKAPVLRQKQAESPGLPIAKPETQRVKTLVSPEQASEWLTKNNRNRHLSESTVYTYACDMEAGRWKYNFVPILISKDGVLIDGQHRLQACVLSGKPFWSDVVFGADMDLQDTIDIGRGRTGADVIEIDGICNATRISAMATLVLQDLKGGIDKITDHRYRPTKPEQHEFVKRHEAELQAALVARMDNRCPPRVLDFCNFKFRRIDIELASRFMADLIVGNGITTDNPVWLLRKRINENAASKAKLPPKELIALIFKTWNAVATNRPMRVLRWNGQSGEEFPKLEGTNTPCRSGA